eukprot:6199514-Pleurochrysis_carterae.AAC.2
MHITTFHRTPARIWQTPCIDEIWSLHFVPADRRSSAPPGTVQTRSWKIGLHSWIVRKPTLGGRHSDTGKEGKSGEGGKLCGLERGNGRRQNVVARWSECGSVELEAGCGGVGNQAETREAAGAQEVPLSKRDSGREGEEGDVAVSVSLRPMCEEASVQHGLLYKIV